MPRAAGARALLSATATTLPSTSTSTSIPIPPAAPPALPLSPATCCSRASRVAASRLPPRPAAPVHGPVHPTPPILLAALPHRLPHRRHALPRRGFHTTPSAAFASAPAPSNPDAPGNEPGPTEKPPPPANHGQPPETPDNPEGPAADADARRERLRSAGYGSARARAARSSRAEEVPALDLPAWFATGNVSLYEERPLPPLAFQLPALQDASRLKMLADMEAVFDAAALTEDNIGTWKDELLRAETGPTGEGVSAPETLLETVEKMHAAAFWQSLLLLLGADGGNSDLAGRLRRRHADNAVTSAVKWPASEAALPEDGQVWLRHVREDDPLRAMLCASPLLKRSDAEYLAGIELTSAVRAYLSAVPAPKGAKQDPRPHPPIILSVLNSKSRRFANGFVRDMATDLGADVLHLSAHALARLLAKHMGQNPLSSRGAISMLGYAAAEMNGRLAITPDPAPSADTWPSLRFVTPMRESLAPAALDGRWDEMKIGAALETLVGTVNLRRAAQGPGEGAAAEEQSRPLIIHLHDYVEMSVLYPSIVHKLRTIADRMSTDRRKVVLVGSSSADMAAAPPQWQDQLVDLGRHSAHVVPVHAPQPKAEDGEQDVETFEENMDNIEDMLRVLLGENPAITGMRMHFKPGAKSPIGDSDSIYSFLSSNGVFEPQFVHALVSVMVGSALTGPALYDPTSLSYGVNFMLKKFKRWESLSPSARHPPYFSPLAGPPKESSSASSSDIPSANRPTGAAAGKSYTPEEKKLLSGLINAKDIHTTFADIIAPPETKESLIGLTTLSLVRPEAFSYGVLKTEHIPGCLLYGPPGTGKTLLAKAVAKESGANMLEVSAADINDKWVGQSEQNVQALFSLARKLAPCVIFLDEADALLARRSAGAGRAAHRETITQFLREWDGLLRPGDDPVRTFIMVATNRPFDLDDAVLRRLPRRILVDLPLAPEREAILRVVLRGETLAPDVDVAALARRTELYSGSDLKNMCVSAAMEAVREELRAKEAWQGEGEYQYPERRVLELRHFEKGLRDIGASSSGDMESLKAIRKFDERYGDAGRGRKTKRGIGFEVVPRGEEGSGEARVRQVGVGGK